jgi:hypothetical protein
MMNCTLVESQSRHGDKGLRVETKEEKYPLQVAWSPYRPLWCWEHLTKIPEGGKLMNLEVHNEEGDSVTVNIYYNYCIYMISLY